MSDLLSVLSAAQTSLAANSALTATASHNIDNAGNANYARQTAALEAVVPADQVAGAYIGRGATLTTVTQSRDRFLEARLPAALGDAASSSAESNALQAFQGLDPATTGGLSDALSGFYSGMRALAQNPSDTGLRTSFLGSAQTLANAFNRTASDLASTRAGLDKQVSALAGEINTEASATAQLNLQIAQAQASGAQPNDLLDLRQAHLDKLAELTGGTPVTTSDGFVNVTLANGVALVAGGRSATLSAQADVSNGGHLGLQIVQADGTGPVALPSASIGGEVGGVIAARDGALATAESSLDGLAYDLAAQVNTVHQAGYGLDGVNGRALFATSATSQGAAATLSVAISDPRQVAAATTAAGLPGDASNLSALLATESAPLAGGKSAEDTLADATSAYGAATDRAQAFSEQDSALKDQLSTMRDSASGVSIDEEMIRLQQAQRGYEAIAQVIKTADSMLGTLLSLR